MGVEAAVLSRHWKRTAKGAVAMIRHRSTTRNLALSAALLLAGTVAGTAMGPPGGEAAGNNLSYPVIWAEGAALALRGEYGTTTPDGAGQYWWGNDAVGDPLTCLPDPDDEAFCDDGLNGSVGPLPGPADVICKAFLQQDELNEWQAASADMSASPVLVDWIDWGDNLESVAWSLNSMVRTEVVLLQDLFEFDCPADLDGDGLVGINDFLFVLGEWGGPGGDVNGDGDTDILDLLAVLGQWGACPALATEMLEYRMRHLFGRGKDEMWGLSTIGELVPEEMEYDYQTTYPQATVYSPCARLIIQRLLVDRGDPRLDSLEWVPTEGWTEPAGEPDELINPPIYNNAAWEGGHGPGFYSAEVNVKGRVIFGYTWNVRKLNEDAGDYRITFSLDATCGGSILLNTWFDEAQIVPPEDEELPPAGGVAVIDVDNNLTYIDITIVP
jgi:hypothetical protein